MNYRLGDEGFREIMELVVAQFVKGAVLFLGAVVFGFLSTIIIGIPLYLIIWLYSMYDAYTTAK